MNIQGMNKLTLLDYPGHTAATIFFGGCNLRCPFCHNPALVLNDAHSQPPLDADEVLGFLKKRQGLLDGVCLTGGEALLDPDIDILAADIKALGYRLKIDTNGTQPDRLIRLYERGLVDAVALDVKNAPAYYGETVGIPNFDPAPVQALLAWLKNHDLTFECRTTVVKNFHDADRLMAIARWIYPTEHYFLQAFEAKTALLGDGMKGYEPQELREFLVKVRNVIPTAQLRGMR